MRLNIRIPDEGFVCTLNIFYLGATENIRNLLHVPFLEGKSSTGRLGIDIHATAGKVMWFFVALDIEISVNNPFGFIKAMPIGQLIISV